ncbi:MAG: Crp/Fnr family transcriptional regulator [Vulcanimicrobiota bacterium]
MLHSKDEIFHSLSKVPLFRKLDEGSLRGISELAEEKTLAKNGVLFRQGDPGDAFYVVMSGSLKLTVVEEDYNFTLAVLGPLDYLGEMALIECFPRSATAESLEDCRLICIRRPAFMASLRANVELALALMVGLAHRLRQTNHDTAAVVHLDLYRRLAQKLIALAATRGEETEDGVRIDVPVSAQTLAEMLGAERPAVEALLNALERQQVIRRSNERLELLDVGPLLDPKFPYRLS